MSNNLPIQALWRVANAAFAAISATLFVAIVVWSIHVESTNVTPVTQVLVQAAEVAPTHIEDADWQRLELPDRLCSVSATPCFDIFRTTFERQPGQMAAYLPRFVGSLEIRLNHETVAGKGDLEAPEDLHFVPVFTRLPNALLRDGENQLDIILTNEPNRYHILNNFYIGLESDLKRVFLVSDYIATDVPTTSIGIYLMLGLLSFSVWMFGGRDSAFAWFAALTLFSGLRSFYFSGATLDPFLVRGGFYFFGSLCSLTAIWIFVRRNARSGKTEPIEWHVFSISLAAALVVTVWDTYAPPSGNAVANGLVRVSAIGFGSAITWELLRYYRSEWHMVQLWSIALFGVAFAFVLHDTIPGMFGEYIPVQLSNLSPLLVVMAFCLIAGRRFSEALQRAQSYNEELTREVAVAKREMAAIYQELATVKNRELIHAERQRFTRDVHDGIGGKLAGVLYMARNPEMDQAKMQAIATQVEESLLDMRSIIDALDSNVSQDLGTALRKFETKIRPWLEQHGLTVAVEVLEGNLTRAVPSSWLLSVFRLLQEGCSNIVKHAEAANVAVKIGIESDQLLIEIADDGIGYEPSAIGRGIRNMRDRCEELGGEFAITSVKPGPGTRIVAQLPIQEEVMEVRWS